MVYVIECILPSGRHGYLKEFCAYVGAELRSPFPEQLFNFTDRCGQIRHVSGMLLGEELGFEYSSHLKFLHESSFRNYPFWGFGANDTANSNTEGAGTDTDIPSTSSIDAWSQIEEGGIHCSVCIKHVGCISGINVGYGLFCEVDVSQGTVIGEYVGCVMVSDSVAATDYCMIYPSNESYHINAKDVGNVIRLCNHSNQPNSEFRNFLHDGMVHILCVTTRKLKAGEQFTVDYGSEYWRRQGVDPATI